MINVLVVDDSETNRQLLRMVLETLPDLKVIGFACDGLEATRQVGLLHPDVIVMDIHMPLLDGYQTTGRILERYAIPIVICSAAREDDAMQTCRAIEVGAVTALPKPPGPGHPEFAERAQRFAATVKAMAEVRVVRRPANLRGRKDEPPAAAPLLSVAPTVRQPVLIVIGVSTGGPPAIKGLLAGLKPNLPVPIVIVQHIAEGFLRGMTQWINLELGLHCIIPADGELLLPGKVYFAPDGCHMGIDAARVTRLDRTSPAEHGLRPSVSYLFRSVRNSLRDRVIGILLTGMGRDGAEELLRMREVGCLTIAQDRDSSLVFGMPGEAVRLGAATKILPPEAIADLLNAIFSAALPALPGSAGVG